MRIFVAANEAIGTRLVRKLIDRGRAMVGASRSPDRAKRLRALGAEPVVLDVLKAPRPATSVLVGEPKRALAGRPIDKEER
jgi:nucleoside-diphosphate-sugar epimerase